MSSLVLENIDFTTIECARTLKLEVTGNPGDIGIHWDSRTIQVATPQFAIGFGTGISKGVRNVIEIPTVTPYLGGFTDKSGPTLLLVYTPEEHQNARQNKPDFASAINPFVHTRKSDTPKHASAATALLGHGAQCPWQKQEEPLRWPGRFLHEQEQEEQHRRAFAGQ
eukprot:1464999-Rhodomonas_salina.1